MEVTNGFRTLQELLKLTLRLTFEENRKYFKIITLSCVQLELLVNGNNISYLMLTNLLFKRLS